MTFNIRCARVEDLSHLASIERLAASRFDPEALPAALATATVPSTRLQAAQAGGMLWVASAQSRQPVGFLLAEALDGDFHVAEMSVLPAHGRRGIGAALLQTAIEHARASGCKRVTLTTFAAVPWNGPFYAGQGFRVMAADEVGPGLAGRLEQERALGLKDRVAMCRQGA